jgi:hypothetical protein
VRRIIFIIAAILALAPASLVFANDHHPGSPGPGSGAQSPDDQAPGANLPGPTPNGDQSKPSDDNRGAAFEFGHGGNFGQPEGDDLGNSQDTYLYAGEVTAVDAAAGTLTLRVHWPGHHENGRHHSNEANGANNQSDDGPPTVDTITVKADANTAIFRNGADATLADIVVGDVVNVFIVADEGQTREQALASPAFAILARSKQTVVTYGFAGRVTAVDTTAGTLTVNVTKATRRARALLGSGAAQSVTFKIGESTIVIVDGQPAQLSALSPGDAAAVGVKASKTASLAEISATPARVVLGQTQNVNPTTKAGSARLRKLSVRAAKATR